MVCQTLRSSAPSCKTPHPSQLNHIACPGTGFLTNPPFAAGLSGLSAFPPSLTVLALCLLPSFPLTCFITPFPFPPDDALDCARTRPAGLSGRGTGSAEAKELVELTLPAETARWPWLWLGFWVWMRARFGGGPSRFLRGSLERQERGTTPCWVPSRRLQRACGDCVSKGLVV